MNCYVHPNVTAVGVCSHCGQGICSACAVKIGGRLYCKTDVEGEKLDVPSVLTQAKVANGPHLTAAIYFFAFFGLTSILIAVILILAGSELGLQQSALSGIPYFSNYVAAASVTAILLGVAFIFLGALYIVTVWWLSAARLVGGRLGMILCVLLAGIFAGVCIIPGAWAYGIAGIILNLTALFLLISAWNELE